MKVEIVRGDLTKQDVDAIVNAANPAMLGGGGVDGAIHVAAGPRLLEACRAVPKDRLGVRCATGEARITPGFALRARWVIHTVGPMYGSHPSPDDALASAVRASLALAVAQGLRTVALPAISCGSYGFPLREAARIAIAVALEPWNLDLVRFVVHDVTAHAAFDAALAGHNAGPDRADRIRGGLYGLLVGDALGVPYEFHDPRNLPPQDAIEMVPPRDFRRSHHEVLPGTWSDDGAHALCLLDSLLDRSRLDLDDFGQRLCRWWAHGERCVDARPFDIGNQTTSALDALESGVPAERAGPSTERDNGNGSLMRVLPLALWHSGDDSSLMADAARQSLPTHGHARAQVCCALYCLWARRTLEGHTAAWDKAVEGAKAWATGALADELALVCAFDRPRGSGYVVDTLHVARIAVSAGPYEVAVRHAIGFGLDTDTTACVTGGIAGLRDGVSAIPERWLGALRGRDQVEPVLERLLAQQ